MATVVSVLTVAAAAMSMPCPPMTARMVAMFLDLSLCQQACGLPSAGASLVLLVLPIELSINPLIDQYRIEQIIWISSIHSSDINMYR